MKYMYRKCFSDVNIANVFLSYFTPCCGLLHLIEGDASITYKDVFTCMYILFVLLKVEMFFSFLFFYFLKKIPPPRSNYKNE